MGSVRARPETGQLFLDFRYRGHRCREQTTLPDTPANRQKVERLLQRVEREISRGEFDYAAVFPGSARAKSFQEVGPVAPGIPDATPIASPLFRDFADTWFLESAPRWRRSHKQTVREVLDKHILPVFGGREVCAIAKPDVLAFRATLSNLRGRRGTLTANRINKIMCFLRMILNEGAERFNTAPAFRGIKPLKIKRVDVQPFSLPDVNTILGKVRADYRPYLTVRFFTGMRTGEVNGLKWKYVDLEKNLILVRETIVNRQEEDGAKTDGSVRDIPMLPIVREAIMAQLASRQPDCPWVFASRSGSPIDAINFANRVWYPLLRLLGLERRRPYQTRHTAATLMLAAGENPEWIARVLGHSTTEMLFRVYSRFVPNLTRSDGRAFTGLVESRLAPQPTNQQDKPASAPDIASLPPDELRAMLSDALRRLESLGKGVAQ